MQPANYGPSYQPAGYPPNYPNSGVYSGGFPHQPPHPNYIPGHPWGLAPHGYPPLSNMPKADTGQADRVSICQWVNCRAKFNNVESLVEHLHKDHLEKDGKRFRTFYRPTFTQILES